MIAMNDYNVESQVQHCLGHETIVLFFVNEKEPEMHYLPESWDIDLYMEVFNSFLDEQKVQIKIPKISIVKVTEFLMASTNPKEAAKIIEKIRNRFWTMFIRTYDPPTE